MICLCFVFNDKIVVDLVKLKVIIGVLGVVYSENQCQVIIGNNVSYVFVEVFKLLFEGVLLVNVLFQKNKIILKWIGVGILDVLIGIMLLLIFVIIGGLMVKLLVMILDMIGIFEKGLLIFIIFNVIGDGVFFFLLVMVVVFVVIKFKINMLLVIVIVGVLVYLVFIDLMVKVV